LFAKLRTYSETTKENLKRFRPFFAKTKIVSCFGKIDGFTDGLRNSESSGPGGLKIEAAGDAIDVEDFSCEKEVRDIFTL
jgi:hypothetical protein